MRNLAISLKRSGFTLGATVFTVILTATNLSFLVGQASAEQVTSRSLALSSTLAGTVTGDAVANSPTNGASTTHTFKFTVPTTTVAIKSVKFQYCTTAIGTCTAVASPLQTSGLAIAAQTDSATPGSPGSTFTNAFTKDAGTTTANVIGITNSTGNIVTGGHELVFGFSGIVNPAVVDAFYVHVTLYSDVAYSATVDDGTVASAITTGINITAKVKETLGFSVTGDGAGGIPVIGGSPNCPALTGSGNIVLGDSDGALSFTTAYKNKSWFRIYTNAVGGAVVQYKGDTLRKNVSTTIAAIANTGAASTVGSEQFGLRFDLTDTNSHEVNANASPATGQLTAAAVYDNTNYAYNTGVLTQIASSTGYIGCSTGAVEYVANISPNTPAGTYTTTVVYYAVPTY